MAVTIDGVGEINGVVLPTTGFGKVLQVVRATDTTDRSTTSTSFVDASLSVTITPQRNTSNIILILTARGQGVNGSANNVRSEFRITDSSNNAISGAQAIEVAPFTMAGSAPYINTYALNMVAYASPATISAVTYKFQFKSVVSTLSTNLQNASNTGQLFAIEVSA